MVDRRLLLIFLAVTLLVSVLDAERARNDNLQDEEMNFANENTDDETEDVIEIIKRFWQRQRPVHINPGLHAHANPSLLTTPRNRLTKASTKSPFFSDTFDNIESSTSRDDHKRKPTLPKEKDPCRFDPCQNGGTCRKAGPDQFYCLCRPGYYGLSCQYEIKPITKSWDKNDRAHTYHCAESPCYNGGECVGLRTTYYCRCKPSYYGKHCEKHFGIPKQKRNY